MPNSQITVASGTIQSLTANNLTAGTVTASSVSAGSVTAANLNATTVAAAAVDTTSVVASNVSTQQLSVAHAFVLTPQIVQATGSNSQASAAPITAPSVVVSASASTRGIRLPSARAGLTELIANAGPTSVRVFPAAGDRIGAGATNHSLLLGNGQGGIFFAQNATTWRVILGV